MSMAETPPEELDFDQFVNGIANAGFQYTGQEEEEPEEEPEPDVETDEPDPGPGPATPPPDTVRMGEADVPLSEVRAFYELGKMLREGSLQPTGVTGDSGDEPSPPAAPPEPLPPTMPSWLDQEDPVQMGVWNTLQEQATEYKKELAEVRQLAEQSSSALRDRLAMENGQAAVTQFRTQYPNISDTEFDTLLTLCQPMVDGFVATSANPIEGVKRALYVSALDFEPTRAKVLGTQSPQQKSTERKRKLGSLSGSGGNGNRSESPRPQLSTDKQSVQEFANALSESYGANGRLS